jgi:hypothetical protein
MQNNNKEFADFIICVVITIIFCSLAYFIVYIVCKDEMSRERCLYSDKCKNEWCKSEDVIEGCGVETVPVVTVDSSRIID